MTTQSDHTDLVARLAKPGADILKNLTPTKIDLLHAAVGIAGECSELLEGYLTAEQQFNSEGIDKTNLIEELGDIEFYVAQARRNLFVERDELLGAGRVEAAYDFRRGVPGYAGDLRVVFEWIAIQGGQVLDKVKKVVIHDKPLVVYDIAVQLDALDGWLVNAYVALGVSRDDVLAANVLKLTKRYGSGSYSDQQAQKRADKAPGQ